MRRILFSTVVICLSLQAVATSKVRTQKDSNGQYANAVISINGSEAEKLWSYLNEVDPNSHSIFAVKHKDSDAISGKGIKCHRSLVGRTEFNKEVHSFACRILLNDSGAVVMDANQKAQTTRSIIRSN